MRTLAARTARFRAPSTLPSYQAHPVYDMIRRSIHTFRFSPNRPGDRTTMALPTTSRAIAMYPDAPGTVHRTELPVPELGSHDVLVKVVRVGVCGTDREIIHGIIGAAPVGTNELVLGHEVLGRVIATGEAVSDLSEGAFVTATVRRPDGCPA